MNNINFNSKTNVKKSSTFKTILISFISGIIGATTILLIFLNSPTFKKLIKSNNKQSQTIDYSKINTNLLSLSNISDTGVAVAQKVLPSVVGIEVSFENQKSQSAQGSGSGVIISSDGYILTNSHVITNDGSDGLNLGKVSEINVYLYNDETPYHAKIVGNDPQSDLSVLKIEKNNLIAAELGDSDAVQVGEYCMEVGNPLGMKSSVTTGSISALNRQIVGENGVLYTLIQTDAAINGGNSGGALVNSNGQVIGINTIKVSGEDVEGLCFAIPINLTKTIFKDLIQYNKVIRPYIGVAGTTISDDTIKKYPKYKLVKGIYIRTIGKYSPAEQAGLKVGDIITSLDNKKVSTMFDLDSIKNSHNIGDKLNLIYYRFGEKFETTITLAES